MLDLAEAAPRLAAAIQACQGRVDPQVLGRAQTILERIDHRLSLSRQSTVIALAGATGSGKSSLFNALTRTALAIPGVQRPTTAQTMAITFGDADTSELLDWLAIGRRHTTAANDLNGVVLLDLADFDSVVTAHRDEVDRLLEVVDELLWVVDPQKYADAVIHERYLRHLTDHADVMVFVINQIDRLSPEQAKRVHEDFVSLLRDDGLANPVVYDVSAMTGQGVDVLRQHIAKVASTKHAMVARLEADVQVQAKALRNQVGRTEAGALGKDQIAIVTAACLQAADVDQIKEAVRQSAQRQGRIATGWPVLSWISSLKLDPLRRLRLEPGWPRHQRVERPELNKSSIVVRPIAQARIDSALRTIGLQATSRLPRSWALAMDRVVRDQGAALPDAIDQAVLSTDLGTRLGRTWWSIVRVLQWLILVAAVGGLVWLAVNFVMTGYLGLPALPTPQVGALPLPTVLAVGGIAIGLLAAGVSRVAVGLGAKTTAAAAVRRLRRAMEKVAQDSVITPINDELRRHDQAKAALDQIVG